MRVLIFLNFVLASLFLLSCQEAPHNAYSQIRQDIENLKTVDQKKIYLENILEEDQAVRGAEGQELMLNYGKDSPEYQAHNERMWETDILNLYKIEKYLGEYGYPDLEQFGFEATRAPWMVIHHQIENTPRDKNFEYIYGAYLSKDIDGGAITFYLNRWYDFVNGERLKMESPFTTEDELAALLKGLDIEERAAIVEKK